MVNTGGNYYTTTYTYNKNGNIKSIVYPSGRQVWYNLNVKNGKPLSIDAIINGESREIITGAEYLPFGSIKSLNFSNGLNLQRSYDLKYRLTSNTNGQINTDYVYDNEYNILSISGSYSRTYGYDDIYRLVSGTGVWGTKGYTYDRNGNRLSKNENGFITSYVYQAGTNRLIQTTGYEPDNFTYNSNGSIVSDSRHTYQYGDNGHLVSVDGGVTARYFYDYEMRRRKAVYTDRTILFFYDLEGKLISELDLSSNKWKDYIYIDLEPIARIDQRQPWVKIGDSYLRADKTGGKVHLDWSLYNGLEAFRVYRSTNDFTFSNPQVIQELNLKTYDDNVLNDGNNYAYRIYKNVPTEGLFFYHTDHLMTPLQMTDENQNIVWQAEYYPFGRIYSQSGDIENNLRFPGQYSETNMNLYYNWHRYYSAKIGRYLENDFITIRDILFHYLYVRANPILLFDYTGLFDSKKEITLNIPPFPKRRPDEKCCSRSEISKAIQNVLKQLSGMKKGKQPSGYEIAGMTFTEGSIDRDGWVYPIRSTIPPVNKKIKDPCVKYCVEYHEWVHSKDRRPWNIYWDPVATNIWHEFPAYKKELECLRSFQGNLP